jgi:S-adenosylmethionine:diacylglycerol 3-amino-3-carboxypropyl transferase
MATNSIAVDAVLSDSPSEQGLRLSDRLFASLFNHLVYPQIWEDPEVDRKASKTVSMSSQSPREAATF